MSHVRRRRVSLDNAVSSRCRYLGRYGWLDKKDVDEDKGARCFTPQRETRVLVTCRVPPFFGRCSAVVMICYVVRYYVANCWFTAIHTYMFVYVYIVNVFSYNNTYNVY